MLLEIGYGSEHFDIFQSSFPSVSLGPAPAIAESIRGSTQDAAANRLVKAINSVANTTEAIARDAGARLASSNSAATINALVVATAYAYFATDILTTDPDGIRNLANADLNIIAVSIDHDPTPTTRDPREIVDRIRSNRCINATSDEVAALIREGRR